MRREGGERGVSVYFALELGGLGEEILGVLGVGWFCLLLLLFYFAGLE